MKYSGGLGKIRGPISGATRRTIIHSGLYGFCLKRQAHTRLALEEIPGFHAAHRSQDALREIPEVWLEFCGLRLDPLDCLDLYPF